MLSFVNSLFNFVLQILIKLLYFERFWFCNHKFQIFYIPYTCVRPIRRLFYTPYTCVRPIRRFFYISYTCARPSRKLFYTPYTCARPVRRFFYTPYIGVRPSRKFFYTPYTCVRPTVHYHVKGMPLTYWLLTTFYCLWPTLPSSIAI